MFAALTQEGRLMTETQIAGRNLTVSVRLPIGFLQFILLQHSAALKLDQRVWIGIESLGPSMLLAHIAEPIGLH
jgi:hypothetical protein